jgi:hypothetical protein
VTKTRRKLFPTNYPLGRPQFASYDETVGSVGHSTRPPTAGIRRLEPSFDRRRTATIIALVLVCFATAQAVGAAWALRRFGWLYPVEIRWLVYFSWTFPILSELWMAYFFYLPAHTVLEFSPVSLRLTRSLPFREWSGQWPAVKQAYFHKGFFAIGTTERLWPGWAIKVAPDDVALIEEFKLYLGPGAWLDGRQATLRLAGRVLLVHAFLLGLTLLGGRLVNHIERALR